MLLISFKSVRRVIAELAIKPLNLETVLRVSPPLFLCFSSQLSLTSPLLYHSNGYFLVRLYTPELHRNRIEE